MAPCAAPNPETAKTLLFHISDLVSQNNSTPPKPQHPKMMDFIRLV